MDPSPPHGSALGTACLAVTSGQITPRVLSVPGQSRPGPPFTNRTASRSSTDAASGPRPGAAPRREHRPAPAPGRVRVGDRAGHCAHVARCCRVAERGLGDRTSKERLSHSSAAARGLLARATRWSSCCEPDESPDWMLMRLSPSLIGFCSGDIGVDLGTDTTVLSAHGGELVIAAPSLVAVDAHTGATLAAGSEALELLGRHGTAAIRPIKDGAIVDLERTAELLRHLIAKVERYRRSRSRVVASVPSGMSALQRRAVADACLAAGAREARLIARPIAAALGCGLPVHEPIGSMVLDIGANSCEAAMISMRAIVTSQSIRVGSHEFDRRIVAHLRRTHQLLIGEHAVQHIKAQVDSPRPDPHAAHIDIAGHDLATGTLRSVRLTNHEIRDAAQHADHPDHRGHDRHPRPHTAAARRRRDRPRDHAHRQRVAPARHRAANQSRDRNAHAYS